MKKYLKQATANPVLTTALLIVAAVLCTTLFGTALAPHDPLHTDMNLRLAPPSWTYPLGNDTLGRCLPSRILAGAHISVGLSLAVVAVSCLLGLSVGLSSGYSGGIADEGL
ncbi:MAG: nickel ABC transporter permease subunit NikC, partial [Candidatus Electrothrix sp. AW5]|nr:nickel ABC transporter permease subunit NikC [Candidatus Electrothrix gigas]